MNYEEAFEALKSGEYHTAVPLLEKAARDSGYASDIINHAYTLALYHCGDKPRLADVSFQVANSLLPHDPASAMDYFQRAMSAGLDAKRVRRIGELFEEWAAPLESTRGAPLHAPVDRVAHVVGCLMPGDARTQYVKMLVSSLKKRGIESTIFTTEWAASWFFNPAGAPQSQPVDVDADVRIASIEGDFVERDRKSTRLNSSH